MTKPSLACVYCGLAAPPGPGACPRCAKPVLRLIKGRYALRRLLAVDDMHVSYEGMDMAAHARVFVRVLRPGAPASAKTMLGVEAGLLQRLNGTAPTPGFVDAGELHAAGTFYCVYEFVEGQSLAEAARKLKPAEIIEHVLQALDGLAALHEAGWVHGRLTLENVLFTAEGEVRLINLRCARECGASSQGLGAPGYKAPEQFRRTGPVTTATDVFAVGCGLYRLLTGRFPYPTDRQGLTGFPRHRPFRPSSLNPGLTGEVDRMLARALAVRPEERYADAAAMRAALWRAFAGTTELDLCPVPKAAAGSAAPEADGGASGKKPLLRRAHRDREAVVPATDTGRIYTTTGDSLGGRGGCLGLLLVLAVVVAFYLAAAASACAGEHTHASGTAAVPVPGTRAPSFQKTRSSSTAMTQQRVIHDEEESIQLGAQYEETQRYGEHDRTAHVPLAGRSCGMKPQWRQQCKETKHETLYTQRGGPAHEDRLAHAEPAAGHGTTAVFPAGQTADRMKFQQQRTSPVAV